MNAQNIIDTLPEQAKRSVLFSLVGSLNASIVGTAASVASKLTTDGYDIRELTPVEVNELMASIDEERGNTSPTLLEARRTLRVARNLRDQLIAVSNNDEDGDINSTLDFMTKPSSRKLDKELLKDVLAAAGIEGVDTAHFEAMQKMSDVQRAERLASQRGAIEWLIEHVFDGRGYDSHSATDGTPEFVDESTNDTLDALSTEQQERVYDKLVTALNKARDNTVLGVLNRDRRYTMSDLSLIGAAIKDAESLH